LSNQSKSNIEELFKPQLFKKAVKLRFLFVSKNEFQTTNKMFFGQCEFIFLNQNDDYFLKTFLHLIVIL